MMKPEAFEDWLEHQDDLESYRIEYIKAVIGKGGKDFDWVSEDDFFRWLEADYRDRTEGGPEHDARGER